MKKVKIKHITPVCITVLLTLTMMLSVCTAAMADSSYIATLISANSAPVAENLCYATYKNVQITGTLSAIDAEGDTVSFEIAKEAKKGTVELLENGTFIYTPDENKKGKDSFSYIAIDSEGNKSETATVSIKIKSQTTDICYADMDGEKANYAALCLAEKGIFTGEKIGNEYFFSPNTPVSRGEFLSMCLNLCGIENLEDITKTGFYDDSEIPGWSKPYIATALIAGIIQGYSDEYGNIVFSPNDAISYSEAAVILNNTLEITDVSVNMEAESDIPSWAVQAAANLTSCNVLKSGDISTVCKKEITRADAAEMLAGALSVLDNRDTTTSIFDYFK